MGQLTVGRKEIGDNRLRTEVQQQLVTRPASETSLSTVASPRTEDQPYLSVCGDSNNVDSNVFPERTIDRSQIAQDGVPVEIIPDQTGILDQVDGSDGHISSAISNLDIERETRSRNSVTAGDLSTRRGHISISDDTDLCTDASLYRSISTGIENTNERLEEARPETLGACQEGSNLSLSSFERDESTEVSAGSPDPDQTNPKYTQSESGYTTQSANTPSPDRQVLLQNKTDDDKIISYYSSLHSDSTTVSTAPEPIAASNSGEKKDAVSFGNVEKTQSQDSTTVSTALEPTAASSSGDEKGAVVSGNVEKKQSQDSSTVSATPEPTAASSSGEEKDAVSSGNLEKKNPQDSKTVSTTLEPAAASSIYT